MSKEMREGDSEKKRKRYGVKKGNGEHNINLRFGYIKAHDFNRGKERGMKRLGKGMRVRRSERGMG